MADTVLYLERTIDASHVIPDHPGKCGRLHGHTYRFEVWMSGEVAPDGDGMLIDFFDIKQTIDAWDHQHLNDMVSFIPTAELLAAEMQRRLHSLLIARGVSEPGCVVRLWETPTSWAQVGVLASGNAPITISGASAQLP